MDPKNPKIMAQLIFAYSHINQDKAHKYEAKILLFNLIKIIIFLNTYLLFSFYIKQYTYSNTFNQVG